MGSTEGSQGPRTLKRGRARTVLRVERDGRVCVVKRFHHPSPWQGWRDGLRARAERNALRRLRAEGFPVPRPLGCRWLRRPAEVHMEAVERCVTLEDLLLGLTPRGVSWPRLLRELGELLAKLETASIRLTDLHPGNVLVDGEEHAWLIDFHAARRRRRAPRSSELLHHLVQAAAWTREALTPRLRLRFLSRWRRALPTGCALEPIDLEELEQRAREERRAFVRRGAARLLRDCPRCRVERKGGALRFVALWPPRVPEGARRLVLEEGAANARSRWLAAARLVEHGVPVAVPRCLEVDGERARGTYALPGASPVRGERLGTEPDAARGRALALLHDRGLDVPDLGPPELQQSGDGAFILAPPPELVDAPLDGTPRTPSERVLGSVGLRAYERFLSERGCS